MFECVTIKNVQKKKLSFQSAWGNNVGDFYSFFKIMNKKNYNLIKLGYSLTLFSFLWSA